MFMLHSSSNTSPEIGGQEFWAMGRTGTVIDHSFGLHAEWSGCPDVKPRLSLNG